MKNFRISLRNVATSVACLAVALMSSAAMAQNVGDQFNIAVSSDYEIKYDAPLDTGTNGDKVAGFVVPNTVDSIFGRVWSTNVCTLTLGTGVKYIDSEVFRGTRFSSITSNAVIPPTINVEPYTDAFFSEWGDMSWTPSCVVNVPCASLYQNSHWGTIFINFNQTATCPATLTVLSSDVAKGHAVSFNVTGDVIYIAQFAACTNTGIENVQANAPLKVFPNPTNSIVNVELERAAVGTLALFDLSGRVVETRNCASLRETINLSALAAGTYILRLVENGNASEGVKIVKQ